MAKRTGTPGLAIAVAALALAACASQPAPQPESPASVPAVAPAPAVSATAAREPVAARPSGYRQVTRDGQVLFCKKEYPSGSRVGGVERCYTGDELDRMSEMGQDYTRRVQDAAGTLTSHGAAGGG